jgi:hypothetical protein
MKELSQLQQEVDANLLLIEAPVSTIANILRKQVNGDTQLAIHVEYERAGQQGNPNHKDLTLGRALDHALYDSHLRTRDSLIISRSFENNIHLHTLQSLATLGRGLPIDTYLQGLVDRDNADYGDEDPVMERIYDILEIFVNNFRLKHIDICQRIVPGLRKDIELLHGSNITDSEEENKIINDAIGHHLIMRMKVMHLSDLYRLYGVQANVEIIRNQMAYLFGELK